MWCKRTELQGNSLDLLWGNVAANAQAIVKAGGACSARALDFNEVYMGEKLVYDFGEGAKVIVLGADVLYLETVGPFTNLVIGLFQVKRNLTFYLAWKPRDLESESNFFKVLEQNRVVFTLLAEMDEHKIMVGKSMSVE